MASTVLTGGEAVVRALAAHGVTQAFGIPGTHNLEIYRHLAVYGVAHVTPRHEQGADARYLHPTGFGTLGYALPAAIGAKTAHPDRQVIALSGDGGLQFSIQELGTAAQLRLPLPVVVFDNGGYGEIRDEMAARGDTPAVVDPAPVDLPALARAYGGHGEHAGTPEALAAALTRALASPGPTVITVPEETTR